MTPISGGLGMRLAAFSLVGSLLVVLSGCSAQSSSDLSLGDVDSCDGITVVVNYGILADDHEVSCVELAGSEAIAQDVLGFAGITTEGTVTYGDQVVCRVNGLPSSSEAFVVEGQEPHLESCEHMPAAFAYWALWVKDDAESSWSYAEEGVATLSLTPGMSVGLAFSTGAETPVPSIP
jgi:hypothetical protein